MFEYSIGKDFSLIESYLQTKIHVKRALSLRTEDDRPVFWHPKKVWHLTEGVCVRRSELAGNPDNILIT